MEVDETKKETATPPPSESEETAEQKSSASSSSATTTLETVEATSSTGPTTSLAGTTENVSEVESRRSSTSLDDEDEGKRNKRRKDKEEHPRKEDARAKEDHKKDDHASKKEEHAHKKEEHTSRGKSSSTNSASPKSTTSLDGQDGDDGMKSVGSPGPKVPPLKIVIPPVETEQGSRNGKNTGRHHPYVVVSNDETGTASSTVTTSPSSPAVLPPVIKEEPPSPLSNTLTNNDDQRIQQRVLRSTHSNRNTTSNNSSSNGTTSGSNSSATSGSSSPAAPDLSPQTEPVTPSKEETKAIKTEPNVSGVKSGKSVESSSKVKTEPSIKIEPADEEPLVKPSTSDARSSTSYHKEETNTVELHPRKRKLKSKQEPTQMDVDQAPSFSSAPHPHEVPVTNCYQMYMDIRKQIDVKRKGLFPIQPKPPQGFKDYLMNRCTYTLSGNGTPRLKRRNADPPEGLPEAMRELYEEQEVERNRLRMQHIVEKEKLVLSVEQEILRVHGRAARALANQALPFSACTILKDEEVYNVITPEQEEKDRNARSRYNGRLFISWLQDVDDKWEKIKEEMLSRHHKEAESLNAIQKFRWEMKMRMLGLYKSRPLMTVDEASVPMISVSDDFDLLP